MPLCTLCGLEKELRKAHIIPRKLYEPMREASSDSKPGDQAPRIYSVGKGQKSRQSQSGAYDPHILCGVCDGDVLGVWDKYGQALLLKSPSPENYLLDNTGKRAAYKIETFDYKTLKLFFLSILWRASITNHEFFAQVDLGPWQEKLKNMILTENPGEEDDFSVILFKYEGELSEIMHSPMKIRQDGVFFYRFRIPKYGFLVKVDKQKMHLDLRPYVVSPDKPLLMRVIEYKESREYERILEIRNQIPD